MFVDDFIVFQFFLYGTAIVAVTEIDNISLMDAKDDNKLYA